MQARLFRECVYLRAYMVACNLGLNTRGDFTTFLPDCFNDNFNVIGSHNFHGYMC